MGKLFDQRYVNPDTRDRWYGRTPLSWAARNGHEGIVKLMLGRKDVDPDSSNKYGRTPLSCAAENGNEGVVKLLLGRKDVHPDTPDTNYGETPLSWAVRNGHEGIVKLLLERNNVNPTRSSKLDRTPLSLAADNGHEGIVKLLVLFTSRLEPARLVVPLGSWTPVRARSSRQETRVRSWTPVRAAKRPVTKRPVTKRPVTKRLEPARLVAPPGSKGSSPLGSCTTLEVTAGAERGQPRHPRHVGWPNTALVGSLEWP